MIILMPLVMILVVGLGGNFGSSLAPELEDKPYILEVSTEEFREIDKELNLRENTDNIELDSQGNIVFVEDPTFDSKYTIVEDKGDITSKDYLTQRKKYVKSKELRGSYTLAGAGIGAVITSFGYYLLVKKAKKERE